MENWRWAVSRPMLMIFVSPTLVRRILWNFLNQLTSIYIFLLELRRKTDLVQVWQWFVGVLHFFRSILIPWSSDKQVCAFVSLLTGARVPTHIAMTGEVNYFHLTIWTIRLINPVQITLRGRVTPVGGIKEKACLFYDIFCPHNFLPNLKYINIS